MRPTTIFPFTLALTAGVAFSQTNLETNAGIQFNFSTPGAANLAMGGAFIAVADDATAAYTNPAGLAQVLYRELHIEGRAFDYTHVFTNEGRLIGEPTKQGFDTLEGIRDGEATDQTAGLSFFAYVHRHKRWTFALFRHELARFQASFTTQGAFLERTRSRSPLGIPGERDGRLASLKNEMDLVIVNHGVSAAWRVLPRLSLGATLSCHDFSIDSTAERFVPALFARTDFETDPLVNVQSQSGDDDDWGFTVGLLWESVNGRWRAGGVFRDGPSFDFRALSEAPSDDPPFEFEGNDVVARFNVPRVYGVGVAWLPNDAIRVTLDYDRVLYSDLTRGFVDIFDLPSLFEGVSPELDRFVIDDADEIHLGFEYYFLKTAVPLAVRFGVWHDPDHSLRFEGENLSFGAIFGDGRSDELHTTFGIGVSRKKYQVHLAVDLSERVSTGSLSAIYHF